MAAGDVIFGLGKDGQPFFPCGPCGMQCHDLLGDNLDFIAAFIAICSDCFSNGTFSVSMAFTGVNGGYTAVWDGVSTWKVVIGSVTMSRYPDGVTDCTGVPDAVTVSDVEADINCSGDNVMAVGISSETGDSIITALIFFLGSGALDTAIANTLGCGFISASQINVSSAGTVTVSS